MGRADIALITALILTLPTALTVSALRKRWQLVFLVPYFLCILVGGYWLERRFVGPETILGRNGWFIPLLITGGVVWLCSLAADDLYSYFIYVHWKKGYLKAFLIATGGFVGAALIQFVDAWK